MASGRFKLRFNSTLIWKKTQQIMQNNQAMFVILEFSKRVQTRVTVMRTVWEVWLKNQESAVCHHRQQETLFYSNIVPIPASIPIPLLLTTANYYYAYYHYYYYATTTTLLLRLSIY